MAEPLVAPPSGWTPELLDVPAYLARLGVATLPGFGPALYELIAGRYEHRPTLITSNKSLTEWAQIVQDVSLAAAIVDRLLHHGQVLYLKGGSYRVKDRAPDDASARTLNRNHRKPRNNRNYK